MQLEHLRTRILIFWAMYLLWSLHTRGGKQGDGNSKNRTKIVGENAAVEACRAPSQSCRYPQRAQSPHSRGLSKGNCKASKRLCDWGSSWKWSDHTHILMSGVIKKINWCTLLDFDAGCKVWRFDFLLCRRRSQNLGSGGVPRIW